MQLLFWESPVISFAHFSTGSLLLVLLSCRSSLKNRLSVLFSMFITSLLTLPMVILPWKNKLFFKFLNFFYGSLDVVLHSFIFSQAFIGRVPWVTSFKILRILQWMEQTKGCTQWGLQHSGVFRKAIVLHSDWFCLFYLTYLPVAIYRDSSNSFSWS